MNTKLPWLIGVAELGAFYALIHYRYYRLAYFVGAIILAHLVYDVIRKRRLG